MESQDFRRKATQFLGEVVKALDSFHEGRLTLAETDSILLTQCVEWLRDRGIEVDLGKWLTIQSHCSVSECPQCKGDEYLQPCEVCGRGMQAQVVSINIKKIRELKKCVEDNGPLLLADAVSQFNQQVVGELLATDEDIMLVPDGGVLQAKE